MTGNWKGQFSDIEVTRSRVFTDGAGVEWEVMEVPGTRVPAARGERCLIFSSSTAIRRVWSYPESWVGMDAAQLFDLSWNR